MLSHRTVRLEGTAVCPPLAGARGWKLIFLDPEFKS